MKAKDQIEPFKPKKSLNMAQLFENLSVNMEQLLGSHPGDVIPVGFRIYALDQKQDVLTSQGFISKGVKLEAFSNEDQAVRIDPSLPEIDKTLLLRASGVVFALLQGIWENNPRALEACSSLWEEARSWNEKAPSVSSIQSEMYDAMEHHKDWEDLDSEKDSLESDLNDKQTELDEANEKIEELQTRITELEADLAAEKE